MTSLQKLLVGLILAQVCFFVRAQYGRRTYSVHAPVSGSQLNARHQQRLASRAKVEEFTRLQGLQANTQQSSGISLTPQQLLKVDSLRLRGQRTSSDLSRQSSAQELAQTDSYLLGQTDSAPPQRQRVQIVDDLRSQQSLSERQELQVQRRQLQEQMSSYPEDPYAQPTQQGRNLLKTAQRQLPQRASQKQKYTQDQYGWQSSGDPQQGLQAGQSQQSVYSDQIHGTDHLATQDSVMMDQSMKQNQLNSRYQDQYSLDQPLHSAQGPKQYPSKSQTVNPSQYIIISDHQQNTGSVMGGANQLYDTMPQGGHYQGQSFGSSSASASVDSQGYRPRVTDVHSQRMMTGGPSRSAGLQEEYQQQTIQQHIASQYPGQSSISSSLSGQQSQYSGGQSQFSSGQSQFSSGQSQYSNGQPQYSGGQSQYTGGQQSSGGQYGSGLSSSSVQSQGQYVQSGPQDSAGGMGNGGGMYDQSSLSSQGGSISGAIAGASATAGGASSGVVATAGASSGMGGATSGMGSMGGASSAASTMGGVYTGSGTVMNTQPTASTGTATVFAANGAPSGVGMAGGAGGMAGGNAVVGGVNVMGGGVNVMGGAAMTGGVASVTGGNGAMGGTNVMGGAASMDQGMIGHGMMGHGMMGQGMMGHGMMGQGMMGHGMMGQGMMGHGMMGHGMMGQGMMGHGMMGHGMMGHGMMGGFFPFMDMESPDSPDPTPAPATPAPVVAPVVPALAPVVAPASPAPVVVISPAVATVAPAVVAAAPVVAVAPPAVAVAAPAPALSAPLAPTPPPPSLPAASPSVIVSPPASAAVSVNVDTSAVIAQAIDAANKAALLNEASTVASPRG